MGVIRNEAKAEARRRLQRRGTLTTSQAVYLKALLVCPITHNNQDHGQKNVLRSLRQRGLAEAYHPAHLSKPEWRLTAAGRVKAMSL